MINTFDPLVPVAVAFPEDEEDRQNLREMAGTDRLPAKVSDAVVLPCGRCGMRLSVGPRSQEMIKKFSGKVMCPLCMVGFQKFCKEHGYNLGEPVSLGNPESKLEDLPNRSGEARMSWFTRNKKLVAAATQDVRMEQSLELSEAIIRPHLQAAAKLKTWEQKRDAVTTLMMALAYAVCIIGHRFLRSDPKEFAEHIGNFIESTMTTLNKAKEHTDGGTSKKAGGDRQSIN